MKKTKSAFSMVELLFVMAVMAVLAAIAIPQYKAYGDRAVEASMEADINNARVEIEALKVLAQ